MAFEPGPGEIVLDAPAFLALVLIVAAAADAQDVAAHDNARLRVGRRRASIGEQQGVAEFDRRGRPFDVFISQLEISSEERPVGTEGVSQCRDRWSPYKQKKKYNKEIA